MIALGTESRSAVLHEAALALADAERDRAPVALLTRAIPDLTRAEAYEIAALRVAEIGRGIIGYKLGYTSAAMREQMGISEPNYGVLLAGSSVDQRDAVAMDGLIHPLVEPEVTFLLGRNLAGPNVGWEEAWDAVDIVFPSLEIVDTRYEDYSFTAFDNVADNSSAARFVLGDPVGRSQAGALTDVAVGLKHDDALTDAGSTGNAMGDPVLALAWLANALAEVGGQINAGEYVMTGGLTKAHAAHAGSCFSASFEGLGSVTARFL